MQTAVYHTRSSASDNVSDNVSDNISDNNSDNVSLPFAASTTACGCRHNGQCEGGQPVG